MGASHDRLTAYAIVSAMERDGRDLLRSLTSEKMLAEVYDQELLLQLRSRAENDEQHVPSMTASELLDYTDFGDLAKLLRKVFAGQRLPPGIAAFSKDLERLQKTRKRVMHSRPLRRTDLSLCRESLATLVSASDLSLPACQEVSSALRVNPNYVLMLEVPVRTEAVFENLPLPDYDETGLIGREADVSALMTLLLSQREVITLVGEGGVGKSAVAIETIYELLDRDDNPYKAIVWTSLKTSGFGPGGARTVRNDVVSTLTLYSDIANTLGLKAKENIEEILAFLDLFPTLLVIDNLETINAGEIRELLRRVPRKSKIFITSRIGVGELEERYVLDPLSRAASIQLTRSLSRNLNVPSIASRSNTDVSELCAELYDIPLAIKWYVGAVANGMSPVVTAADKSQLLDYCFSGVYASLPDDARGLLRTFQFAKRSLTAAELAYFSVIDDYRKALNLLLATSVVRLMTDRTTNKTVYALTEFSAAFLREYAPPTSDQFAEYLKRETALSAVEQHSGQAIRADRYSRFTVTADLQDRDMQVAAIYLRSALAASKARRRDEAIGFLVEAKRLCPDNAEVYKVSATIYSSFEEYFTADEHYRIALDYAEDAAPIKALYAQFLFRKLNARFLEAAALANEAYDEDPCEMSAMIKMRANLYVKETARVLECANDIIRGKFGEAFDTSVKYAYTTAAEACRREAEPLHGQPFYDWIMRGLGFVIDAYNDNFHDDTLAKTALELIAQGTRVASVEADALGSRRVAAFVLDHQAILYLADQKALSAAIGRLLGRMKSDDTLIGALSVLRARIDQQVNGTVGRGDVPQAARSEGVIHAYKPDRGFGFITLADGRQAYFRKDALANVNVKSSLNMRRVSFELQPNPDATKYARATNLRDVSV